MENPYAPPVAEAPPGLSGTAELATLSERFLGAFIDGLISIGVVIILFLLLIGVGVFAGIGEYMASSLGQVVMVVLTYGIFLLIHQKPMRASGQTIGKRVAKIRVVTMSGDIPTFGDQAIKRYGFMQLIAIIPFVGTLLSLVNILFIFRADRRCIHDLVANTRVIKANPLPAPAV